MTSFFVNYNEVYLQNKRKLDDSSANFIMILLALVFIVFKVSLFSLIIITQSKPNSWLNFLFDGLHKNQYWILLYWIHYFVYRLILGFLITLSTVGYQSTALITLLVMQFFSILYNSFWFYESKLLYIQVLITREINLFVILGILSSVVFFKLDSPKFGIVIIGVNLCFGMFFAITSMIETLLKIKCIWNCCCWVVCCKPNSNVKPKLIQIQIDQVAQPTTTF